MVTGWRVAVGLGVALLGCDRAPLPLQPRPRGALRLARELPIDGVGGDDATLLVDPGGTLWAAVTGTSTADGRCRLFHRQADGTWRLRLERPFSSELSLSSFRAGEVYFGFNQALAGNQPTLLRVTDEVVEPLPAPAERVSDVEYLQVGAYAITGEGQGWACGQRGSLWQRVDGAWARRPSPLSWTPADRANDSYCASIALQADGTGLLSTLFGRAGAGVYDGQAWRPVPSGPGLPDHLEVPASGLGRAGERLFRLERGAWKPLPGPGPLVGNVVWDATGTWGVAPGGVVAVGPDGWQYRSAPLPVEARAVAAIGADVFVLSRDGVYRSTERDVPTFADAPPGALPIQPLLAQAVDLDGDGHPDLVGLDPTAHAASRRGEWVALHNDGTGHFTLVPGARPTDVVLWPGQYALGDLDGDGDLDLAVISGGQVQVWTQRFGALQRSSALPGEAGSLELADWDGDGDLDVLVLRGGLLQGDAVQVFLNDGAAHFTALPPIAVPAGGERLLWDDLDGDGRIDAVETRWRDPGLFLRHTADGQLQPLVLPFPAEGAALLDLDGDGRPEIYGQTLHLRGSDLALWFHRCVLLDGGCAPDAAPRVPAGVAVDLDLDGRTDVITQDLRGTEPLTGSGTVWQGTDGGWAELTLFTGDAPQAVAIDADGDGDPDLYLPGRGLRLSTSNPGHPLRVQVRQAQSDRLARGAWVTASDAAGRVVASARAETGEVTLGVPEADRPYALTVRFPTGAMRAGVQAKAGDSIQVADQPEPAHALALARLWAWQTLKRTGLPEALETLLAGLLLGALGRRRGWPRPAGLRAAGGFGAGLALLLGVAVRAPGGAGLLLGPALLGLGFGVGEGAARAARRRAMRRAGKFELEEQLGEGAAATVWRARDGSQEVALKLFDAVTMQSSAHRDRFFREARTGTEIQHPHLVRILEAGQLDDGRGYLAMQLVEGQTLAKVLQARGKLPVAEACRVASEVAQALSALHQAGIVHRDVKGENVVIRADGAAVLTDLGLVRSALFKTVTRLDVAVGTLAYMSPEQCVGRNVDGRSDVWSLGVVLFELLTGARPFFGEHELELVYRIHNSELPPLTGVPEPVAAIVRRCLERDPEARFATADALAEALAPFAEGS
jgi:tRNA A-37 threonylcarbamoyl transferase component Bud32